ncbi:MAG: hypothetical protein GY710_10745 [Desulfobacteraceae bacterium]|nr:hypothetical protein [Desulfobacteraceae bacterium]
MKIIIKITITAIIILGIGTAAAFAADTENRQPMDGHKGPPPEAYTACENKSTGDTAQFTGPDGKSVTGTCEQEGDRLVLRPDNPPGGKNSENRQSMGGHKGPPPEAYTACENKTAGDTAKFTGPDGRSVTGTCEQEGDRLVLRSDNPPDDRKMDKTNN